MGGDKNLKSFTSKVLVPKKATSSKLKSSASKVNWNIFKFLFSEEAQHICDCYITQQVVLTPISVKFYRENSFRMF